MQSLEIISLRTSGPPQQKACQYMKKFCRIIKKYNLSEAGFYIHDSITGDFAIIISSNAQESKVREKALGVYMTEVLKQFGLVDYNCWHLVDHK